MHGSLLTVRYILDPDGLGVRPEDVVRLYDAMGSGTNFVGAMGQELGVNVFGLEADYWDTIMEYLDTVAPTR